MFPTMLVDLLVISPLLLMKGFVFYTYNSKWRNNVSPFLKVMIHINHQEEPLTYGMAYTRVYGIVNLPSLSTAEGQPTPEKNRKL